MKLYEVFEEPKNPHSSGTFGCLQLDPDQAYEIAEWCHKHNIECQDPAELHCTVMFSERPCPELAQFDGMDFRIPAKVLQYRIMGPALAVTLDCPGAADIHKRIMQHSNATYKWPDYLAHMSLNYSEPTEMPTKFPRKELLFTKLHITPLDKNFAK
ncbi:hypothetical protein UFOVP29_32 [uncultured Caudovirales phage]|uniref:Anti-CBASS protein Acb1 n=1 Tax=uncultured Caudovirales phage TaxID=2100421 RepID=A0A6J5KMU1_9CAUD|nr:hypothetical protein UFOVP29_32 [uncultured Caudovirales phage]